MPLLANLTFRNGQFLVSLRFFFLLRIAPRLVEALFFLKMLNVYTGQMI